MNFWLWICLASIPMPSSPSGMNRLALAVNKPLICVIELAPLELWHWQNSWAEWCCCIFVLQSALTHLYRKKLEKCLWALAGKGYEEENTQESDLPGRLLLISSCLLPHDVYILCIKITEVFMHGYGQIVLLPRKLQFTCVFGSFNQQ